MTSVNKWRLRASEPAGVIQLDDAQRTAVNVHQGLRVVLGGPGTGKSTVLTQAVVERIRAGSSLDRLVVLASSRTAAQSLRREIVRQRGGAEVGARVTTIHGFALALMRELGDPEQDFRLLRAPDQEQRLRDLLDGLPPEFWPQEVREAAGTRTFARQLREVLARARQLGLDPDRVEEIAGDEDLYRAMGRFFELHLTVGDFHGALDYAELVHRTRILLTEEGVARSCQARFDGIFVDDAQELDEVSFRLVADLARLGLPVLATADPQQRLGAYRGASGGAVGHLLGLPESTRVELRTGYRNSPAVTAALARLRSALDASEAPPVPEPVRTEPGTVTVTWFDDPAAERAHLAARLRQAVQEGYQWRDLAVVTRRGGAEIELLAQELSARGIPVDVDGEDRALGAQKAVRALLAALAHAAAPHEMEADLPMLLTGPLGGLDAVQLRRLGRRLLSPGSDSTAALLGAAANPSRLDELGDEDAATAARLVRLLSLVGAELAEGCDVGRALWLLWAGTPWPERLRQAALNGNRSAEEDLDALVDLFDLATRRMELRGISGALTFIQEIEREEIAGDTTRELAALPRGVRLLTAHRARSGVWRQVHVVSVTEGSWPRSRWQPGLLDPDRLAPDHLDAASTAGLVAAERRSFYVACSRASEALHVSAPMPGEEHPDPPSRFCRELGVTPQEIHGPPVGFLTPQALVADLRRVLEDPTSSPGLRRAAALRLARFPHRDAAVTNWWGARHPSSGDWTMADPVVITGSSLQGLVRCPRNWFLSRRGGGDQGRGTQATVGDVVHMIAQRAARDDLDLEQMVTLLDEVWPRLRFPRLWRSRSEREQVVGILTRFHRWHRDNPGRLLGVEVPFEAAREVSGTPVLLRGTVDRLELHGDRLVVVDLKTTRTMPTRTELAEHSQLGVYQLAARLGAFAHLAPPGTRVGEPSLLQLRHGLHIPQQQYQTVLPEGRSWLDEQLEQAVATLRSGHFDARESVFCRWCPFRDSCPAVQPGGLL
ncbi:MAG: ATP-dependent DNA helicase [Arachnia propionica]|uniref:ATP-dependent helicase n=1 Tax=Arachnia propionica TaxID=1750 RepID=UPI0026F7DA5E|nr:ATP-dependent DNA helicase [Arachnia propionica]